MNHDKYDAMKTIEPERVMASTLCMMSCTMQSGSWQHIEKIADNLNWLSDCIALEAPLRRLCQHLACHWEAELSVQESRTDVAETVAHSNLVPNYSSAADTKKAAAPATDLSINAHTAQAKKIATQVILKAQIH